MVTVEIIVFIASILFGILLYWRESKSNKIYKFFNKLFYSQELQMKPESKKGFLYQQSFLMRLVYLGFLYLLIIVLIQFILPFNLGLIYIVAPSLFACLIGTYLANLVFRSSEIIDETGDALADKVKDTVEKGKDFIEHFEDEKEAEIKVETKITEGAVTKKKSARQRLKDKGHL